MSLRYRDSPNELWRYVNQNNVDQWRTDIERLNGELEKGAQRLSDFRAAFGQMEIEKAGLLAEIAWLQLRVKFLEDELKCSKP